ATNQVWALGRWEGEGLRRIIVATTIFRALCLALRSFGLQDIIVVTIIRGRALGAVAADPHVPGSCLLSHRSPRRRERGGALSDRMWPLLATTLRWWSRRRSPCGRWSQCLLQLAPAEVLDASTRNEADKGSTNRPRLWARRRSHWRSRSPA